MRHHGNRGTRLGRRIGRCADPEHETHDSNNAPTTRYTEAVLQHLKAEVPDQPWWLGYLDKPADVVFSEAPRVDLYATWKYVLVKAGPDQAAAWRSTYWGDPLLPDLMFPHDRSWWRCCIDGAEGVSRSVS